MRDEIQERLDLIKRRQTAASTSTGMKALIIATFTEDLPWLIEQVVSLETENQHLRTDLEQISRDNDGYLSEFDRLNANNTCLIARVQQLEEALRPFARAHIAIEPYAPSALDADFIEGLAKLLSLTFGDLRRATEAMGAKGEKCDGG